MDINTEALAIIDEEYKLARATSELSKKAAHYNNIIQIRASINQKNRNEVYLDIKNFIRYYIASADELNFGYDNVSFTNISSRIVINDIEAEINLHKYALKQLKSQQYLDEAKSCEAALLFLTKKSLKNKRNIYDFIHWFYLVTTQSKTSITISLLITIISTTIILLPSYSPNFACISYSTSNYCNTIVINRLANTISLMTGIDEKIKVGPANIWGFFILLIGKAFFLLVVGSILLKHLKSKLNIE